MGIEMPIRAAACRALVAVVTVAACCALMSGAARAGGRSLPRVYVFTAVAAPGQPAPEGQAERQAAVRDIRQELRRKPGLMELVATPADAQVSAEVISREAPSSSRCLLTARLSVAGRSYARQFQGEGVTCQDAASLIADAVRRWVNESY